MQADEEVEVSIHLILILALYWVKWLASRPDKCLVSMEYNYSTCGLLNGRNIMN